MSARPTTRHSGRTVPAHTDPSRPTQRTALEQPARTDPSRPAQRTALEQPARTDPSRPTQRTVLERPARTDPSRPTQRTVLEQPARTGPSRPARRTVSGPLARTARWRLLAALTLALGPGALPAAEPSPDRAEALLHMVRNECGACHGLHMNGGLGPALLPASLAGRPVPMLVDTLLEGRPGTAMPPWREFLSQEEAEWVVRRLLEGLPAQARP